MTAAGRRAAKHAELQLGQGPESEDRYRLLVELSPDGHVVHRNGQVVYINTAALAMLGCVEDEVVGRPITEFVAPDSQPAMMARIAKLRTPGQASEPAELQLLRRDGSLVTVETISVPTQWMGEPAFQ